MKYTHDDTVAEGDRVVTRYTMTGTHKGAFGGIPATGKHFEIKGVSIIRVEGQKIAEERDFPDMLGLMTQLGTIPSPAPKK